MPIPVGLKINNLFCADDLNLSNANQKPVSIRCPHCRELGSFDVAHTPTQFAYRKAISSPPGTAVFFASIRICPNDKCRGLVFVIQCGNEVVEIEPPELIDFSTDDLPRDLQATLKEAVACHGAGAYRAAAMMVRRLLEEICDANGATGDSLHRRLIALKSKIILPQDLFDAMFELKALGNDAAHIQAKAYNTIGKEEAADSIELAKEILKALYQLKGLVSRLQARKASPVAPP